MECGRHFTSYDGPLNIYLCRLLKGHEEPCVSTRFDGNYSQWLEENQDKEDS